MQTELEPWDSWGGGDSADFSNHTPANHQYMTTDPSQQTEEEEVDFFQDMKPEVRKTKKVGAASADICWPKYYEIGIPDFIMLILKVKLIN